MKKASIKSIIRKKYRMQTTDSNHEYAIAENHLNRDFSAQVTGQKWVSDLDLRESLHPGPPGHPVTRYLHAPLPQFNGNPGTCLPAPALRMYLPDVIN